MGVQKEKTQTESPVRKTKKEEKGEKKNDFPSQFARKGTRFSTY